MRDSQQSWTPRPPQEAFKIDIDNLRSIDNWMAIWIFYYPPRCLLRKEAQKEREKEEKCEARKKIFIFYGINHVPMEGKQRITRLNEAQLNA